MFGYLWSSVLSLAIFPCLSDSEHLGKDRYREVYIYSAKVGKDRYTYPCVTSACARVHADSKTWSDHDDDCDGDPCDKNVDGDIDGSNAEGDVVGGFFCSASISSPSSFRFPGNSNMFGYLAMR